MSSCAGSNAIAAIPTAATLADPPVLWHEGHDAAARLRAAPAAPPVLVVPSLINRAYILDLAPGKSLLRFLAGQGLRPLLVDWGAAGRGRAAASP